MILHKSIEEFYNEKIKQLKRSAHGGTIAAIQVGEKGEYTRLKAICEEIGVAFEWYYFDEDQDIVFEIENLQPFAKKVIFKEIPLTYFVQGALDYLKVSGFEGSTATIFLDGAEDGKGLAERVLDEDLSVSLCVGNKWGLIGDVILTNSEKRLNCYAIHVPVFDFSGNCFNTEFGEYINKEDCELLACISLLEEVLDCNS